jgi:hypothetical protein
VGADHGHLGALQHSIDLVKSLLPPLGQHAFVSSSSREGSCPAPSNCAEPFVWSLDYATLGPPYAGISTTGSPQVQPDADLEDFRD